MHRCLGLLIALAAGAHALQLPTGTRRATDVSRRRVLECAPFVAVSAAVPLPAIAIAAPLDKIKKLSVKARSLRTYVRQAAASRRRVVKDPASGNYADIVNTVMRGRKEVLLPLQAAITAAAAATPLPEGELKAQLDMQPQELKGHLSELDYYLQPKQVKKGISFEEYTSKTTGDTYPGGKVERELEEVCDTASDVVLLLQGKAAPVRED